MDTDIKNTPLNHHEHGKPFIGWFSAIALVLLFAGALTAFPPLADASKEVPMPDWAKFFGRFHVVALHLPVGVFILAGFMEFVCLVNKKHGSYLVPATTFVLHVAAWGATIAVIFGLFLSRKGGFGSVLFQAHQTLGIIAAIGVILTLVLKLLVDGKNGLHWLYRSMFGLSLFVLSVGAHFGGDLVHGDDYLVKYAPPTIRDMVSNSSKAIVTWFEPVKAKEIILTLPPIVPNPAPQPGTITQTKGSPTVYAALVAPLLEAKCNACHNEDKHKANLRLDSHELILKGSDNGAVLVVGQPEESKLVTCLQLAASEDDHMPPEEKPQPSKQEIALLCWWIKEGAREDLKVADAKFPDALKSLVQTMLASSKGGSAGGAPPVMLALADVAATATAIDPNAAIFKTVVEPILASKCTSCHGTEKAKGKLKLHTFADIMKGGSDGKTTVIAGKPDDSLLVKRPKLPADDDDHMPPKEEKQLTKEELNLLFWWIEQGASDTLTLAVAKKTPDIEAALKIFATTKRDTGGSSVAKESSKPKAKPLTDAEKKSVAEVTAKMTALNASLMPLALDTEQLRFGCVNAADKFGDKEIAELAPVADQILWMDLARSKVTDDGLSTLSKMAKLERLHLENTAVTDAGIAQIAGLKNLEYLNLYGTKITDAGISKLVGNKALRKLFVWQTAVTQDAAKKLEAAVPGLVVNVGLSEAEIAKLVESSKPPAPPQAGKLADPKKADAAKPKAKPVATTVPAKPGTTPPEPKK